MMQTRLLSLFNRSKYFSTYGKLVLWLSLSMGVLISSLFLKLSNPIIISVQNVEQNQTLMSQPFEVQAGRKHIASLKVVVDFVPGQNTTFVIEPQGSCISHVFFMRQSQVDSKLSMEEVSGAPFCSQKSFDFSSYFKQGMNEIVFEVRSRGPKSNIFINSQLWGGHAGSTLACLGIFIMLGGMLLILARNVGLSWMSAGIFILGMGYYAFWMHLRPNLSYTNDLSGHINYIRYMVEHWSQPYGYMGRESFQPPLYYGLAARVFHFFSAPGLINPLTAVRAFSLIPYSLFCVYGLRTLRDIIEKENLTYYVGCLLIIFWPAGVIMATRINNDIAVYASWTAAFFYLARWHRLQFINDLCFAIALGGLSIMIKSSAYLLMGVIGGCLIYSLLSRRLKWRALFSEKKLFFAFTLLLLGIVINAWRLIWHAAANTHFGEAANNPISFYHFIYFDVSYFITHPFVVLTEEPGFLGYFLKTMLYGDFTWARQGYLEWLPGTMNLLLLAIVTIIFVGVATVLTSEKRSGEKLVPYLLGVLIPVLGVVGLTISKRWVACQDFRFVLPLLIPMVVLFVYGMEAARRIPSFKLLYCLGMGVGLGLPICGVIFYLGQYIN